MVDVFSPPSHPPRWLAVTRASGDGWLARRGHASFPGFRDDRNAGAFHGLALLSSPVLLAAMLASGAGVGDGG